MEKIRILELFKTIINPKEYNQEFYANILYDSGFRSLEDLADLSVSMCKEIPPMIQKKILDNLNNNRIYDIKVPKPNKNINIAQHEYKRKIRAIKNKISEDFVDRDKEINVGLMSIFSQEHCLFLGEPGVGKSKLSRKLSKIFTSDENCYFEKLLTNFSLPEELFGPYSISKLKKDLMERNTKGYLPNSNIAFIDEIFKANTSILNTLLDILNERKFKNGEKMEDLNFVTMFGASNSVDDTEELEALNERFLFKVHIKPIDKELFGDFVDQCLSSKEESDIDFLEKVSKEELDLLRKNSKSVSMSSSLKIFLRDLRDIFKKEAQIDYNEINEIESNQPKDEIIFPKVSDRTWAKIISLLRIVAWTNGRNKVDISDFFVIQNCFLENERQEENTANLFLFDKIYQKMNNHKDYNYELVFENVWLNQKQKTMIIKKLYSDKPTSLLCLNIDSYKKELQGMKSEGVSNLENYFEIILDYKTVDRSMNFLIENKLAKDSIDYDSYNLAVEENLIDYDSLLVYECQNEKISIEFVEHLMNFKGSVNFSNKNGIPLHVVCQNKKASLDVVKLLIEKNSDVNFLNENKNTPLHELCSGELNEESFEIMKYFEKRANVNALNNKKETPLHLACLNENTSLKIVQFLVENKAKVVSDDFKSHPLHYACKNKNFPLDIVEYLVEQKSNVNFHSESDGVPLSIACLNDNANWKK